MHKSILNSLALAATVVIVSGCGGGGREEAPKADVSGTVTVGGKALADVNVYFVGQDHEFTGSGQTDASGKFSLITGAAIGKNKVYFSKIQDTNFNPEEGMDDGQFEAMNIPGGGNMPGATAGAEVQNQIPAKYASAATTPIIFDVPEGGSTSADFKLE